MNKYAIEVNGRWFITYTDTLEQAVKCATACMAAIVDQRIVGESQEITRWED